MEVISVEKEARFFVMAYIIVVLCSRGRRINPRISFHRLHAYRLVAYLWRGVDLCLDASWCSINKDGKQVRLDLCHPVDEGWRRLDGSLAGLWPNVCELVHICTFVCSIHTLVFRHHFRLLRCGHSGSLHEANVLEVWQPIRHPLPSQGMGFHEARTVFLVEPFQYF